MLLKVKSIHLIAGKPIAMMHAQTAKWLNLHANERIKLKKYGKKQEMVAPVDIVKGILKEDEIALSQEIINKLKLKSKTIVDVVPSLRPLSVSYIIKKLDNSQLTFTEYYAIVSDIVNNKLTEAEIAYFVSAVYLRGLSLDEITSLTKSMVKTGKKLDIPNPIVIDKHGIGGIEGNRTTPIVTSVIAALIDKLKLNAVMPKTSSRAITSAAGTADVIEILANVEFSTHQIKQILKKTNACLVWGGSLGLAPADDKIIQVERLLSLDPEAQLIASILSKKLSVNASHVLIDISYGKSAKVKNLLKAQAMGKKFYHVAKKLNLNLKVVLTNGDEPVGNGIGAALEMLDVLAVLKQDADRPLDLEKKSLFLASTLLAFVTGMQMSKANEETKKILESGEAFMKFKQIIEAQNGSLKNIDEKLRPAKFKAIIKAKKSGIIKEINNKKVAYIAKIAGCPADKKAGLLLHKHLNNKVKKNEALFTIYAETRAKLEYAKKLCERVKLFVIES